MIHLIEKVKSAVEKYNMIKQGDFITIGLSGGADSVALTYALLELKDFYRINIQAVHINHCLRGKESDDDENFCRMLCEKLDIPFFSKKINVISYMQKTGKSCEESARILRYNVFNEYCGNGLIATAHTLSDNVETVIHNLVRGTGLKGLTGIPPVRDNIIRPLIMAERKEIEEYLASKCQNFVTDRTNLTDDYTRNKIRHHTVPQLEKINPSFLKTMSSNIMAFKIEDSFISEMSAQAYSKCLISPDSLSGLENYHQAIRNRCISRFLNEHNLHYSYERISAVDSLIFNDGKINIAKNVYIISKTGILFIENISDNQNNNEFRAVLHEGTNLFAENRFCFAEYVLNENYVKNKFVHKNSANYAIDYDKISGEIFIRSRKYGDKIKLAGKSFTSSVKKTLINMKIPASVRSKLCFLEDSQGLIFVEKMGIAQRAMPDGNTKKLLIISISENQIDF